MTFAAFSIAIVGGGPAGMMAAETLAGQGARVTIYEHKATPGRKFLMAGRGGLNLTHSEPLEAFLQRYGAAQARMAAAVRAFTPGDLRAWADDLGAETFVGSSGRIFPKAFKASPLLRAWQARLQQRGVVWQVDHRWEGWTDEGRLKFSTGQGAVDIAAPDALLLALGGASWPRLGSDGCWVPLLAAKGLSIAPLQPANCGFHVPWSDVMKAKFAGAPLKPVIVSHGGQSIRGECMITEAGIEGGAIYALSHALRDSWSKTGAATIFLNLRPDLSQDDLTARLSVPRRGLSLSNFLRRAGGLSPLGIGLMQESGVAIKDMTAPELARLAKKTPLILHAPSPLDRAISSAGGIKWDEIDDNFMLKKIPGVFVAGEMIDWEAPTGGYLLQGCFSTAQTAAHGIAKFLS